MLLSGCDSSRSSATPATPTGGEDPTLPVSSITWTPLVPHQDTRNVYLSSSTGNDGHNGLSPQSPKATLGAALQLMRNGYPDWLHIRRGDQFSGGLGDWWLSGRAEGKPMVITTYGPSANRPVFNCGNGDGINLWSGPVHDVAFVGIHLLANGYNGVNGNPYGLTILSQTTRVLFEDMKIERFFTNIRMQGAHVRGVKMRRSVIIDAFTTGSAHAQGIYVEGLKDLLLEECVFDHNGWNENVPGAIATIFRHNCYLQGDTNNCVVRGNIIARAGSHGLQARSGGVVHSNLFLGNSINLLVGSNTANNGALTASVIGNVILDGKNISPGEPRGWSASFQCLAAGEVAYNIAAHQVTGTNPQNYEFNSNQGQGIRNVDFHHNVSYRWGAPLAVNGGNYSNFRMHDNELQEFGGSDLVRTMYGGGGFYSANNRIFTTASSNAWMNHQGSLVSLPTWKSMVGDTSSSSQQMSYPAASQTIAGYDLTVGGSGSLASFLSRARDQSRTNWDDRFCGTHVSAHFRNNFGVVVP
ncbi:MAG TPA: hypothetical protein VF384_03630 [Planctomycetota bacterium]